jgi:hypothetical protein
MYTNDRLELGPWAVGVFIASVVGGFSTIVAWFVYGWLTTSMLMDPLTALVVSMFAFLAVGSLIIVAIALLLDLWLKDTPRGTS